MSKLAIQCSNLCYTVVNQRTRRCIPIIASEFAQRLGVPVSKIRYYDRLGLGQTERSEENNYRNFEPDDALEYGNALMLRSFDMNLKEISQTQSGQSVNEMGIWLEEHVRELVEKYGISAII